jgi:integrase
MRLCRIAVNRFVSRVIFPNEPLLVTHMKIHVHDLGERAAANSGGIPKMNDLDDNWPRLTTVATRDHFTQPEVNALLAVTKPFARDYILLLIMSETGLRRRAISWLTVDAVYDTAAQCALQTATAMEKGLVVRSFQLSNTTKMVLHEYIQNHLHTPYRWLFPSPHDNGCRPVGSNTINVILNRACKRAGISGRHCHTHAMRKFVVCQLMAAANRIENIAKWIGHRSVNVTYRTYWDLDLRELVSGMRIPWLVDELPTNQHQQT